MRKKSLASPRSCSASWTTLPADDQPSLIGRLPSLSLLSVELCKHANQRQFRKSAVLSLPLVICCELAAVGDNF